MTDLLVSVPLLVSQVRESFGSKVRPQLQSLAALIDDKADQSEGDAPGGIDAPGQYYKFHGMFAYTLQRLVFVAALANYFESESLLSLGAAAGPEWLGIKVEAKDGLHLEVEDFLGGLILVSNELVNMIVNQL